MGKASRMDVGLLILRIGFGLLFTFYGVQKAFGVFGGRGYVGQVDHFISQGMPPALAHAAILIELLGGVLLLLGLLTPAASLLLAALAGYAMFRNMSQPDAWEAVVRTGQSAEVSRFFYTFLLLIGSLAILTMGAGKISLDAKLFRGGKKKG